MNLGAKNKAPNFLLEWEHAKGQHPCVTNVDVPKWAFTRQRILNIKEKLIHKEEEITLTIEFRNMEIGGKHTCIFKMPTSIHF